jgi:hypothetical protein
VGRASIHRDLRHPVLVDEDATARLSGFSPIFPVRDLSRALAHYASLGFDVQP